MSDRHENTNHRDIIVVGASAGGVEALCRLVAGLPEDLPAAVFVALHIPADSTSTLPQILSRYGPLSASHPGDDEPIRYGRIYVAPPDLHLLVGDGTVRLSRGPKENRHRPAVDTLFRSAALTHGSRVIGVILSGAMDDGTAGLIAIKRPGGVAVVQDPKDALFPGMPTSALTFAEVDHTVPAGDIGALLGRIAREQEKGTYTVPEDAVFEAKASELDLDALHADDMPGELSDFTCPECHGPLRELRDDGLLRFRCQTGHGFTAESLLVGEGEALEQALYASLNVLKEHNRLTQRLKVEARERGHERVATRMADREKDTAEHMEVIQRVLLRMRQQAGLYEMASD